MPILKVILPNEYYPVGTFLWEQDDVVQKVRTWTEGGRLKTGGFEGIALPVEKVRPYVFKILKRGFDDQGAHAEVRGAFKHRRRDSLHGDLEDGDSDFYRDDVSQDSH